MAEIVLGIGCAHTPQLHTPADKWEIRAERDKTDGVPMWYRGERMKYAEVEAARKDEGFAEQTEMSIRQERLENSYKAIDVLSDVWAKANIDVAIIFGNDQGEMFLRDIKPAFTIMGCEQFENMPRTDEQKTRLPPGIEIADPGHLPDDELKVFPGHPELAQYLCKAAMAAEFDVSYSHEQHRADPAKAQLSGMPHSYGFIFKQVYRDNVVPTVPIDTNTFFPPNQPPASRAHALGKIVGDAIRNWEEDARVAVVATGGLSHFVVMEDWDREIMQHMADNDFEHLLTYHEGWYQAGSSEIKSWIATGGAMQGSNLSGHIVDYYALYRTPAGTGSSAAFMYWD